MNLGAYLVGIAAGGFYLLAGIRLWRLSRRTHERPELLLAIFFVACGQWYLLFNGLGLIGVDPLPSLVNQAVEWAYAIGVIAYVIFLRSVFRPKAAWGRYLAWLSCALILAGCAGSTLRGGFSNTLYDPAFQIEWVGYTIPCVWMFVEGLAAHSAAKRRARFGVGDWSTAHRYLLWTYFGLSQIASCLADLRWVYENGLPHTDASMAEELLEIVEIVSVAILWLVFFPPSFYTKWIARRAAQRET